MSLAPCQALDLHCLFNSHYSLLGSIIPVTPLLSLYLIDKQRCRVSEKLRNLPKVTQLASGHLGLDPGWPSSTASAFRLLCSTTFQKSQTIQVGRGREAEQSQPCFKTLPSESSPGLSLAPKALPGYAALLLCTCTLATIDCPPSPNSPGRFMFRLFLLSDVACPPLLSLTDTILNLQGLVLPCQPFLSHDQKAWLPSLRPPSTLFILSTVWWAGVSHLQD